MRCIKSLCSVSVLGGVGGVWGKCACACHVVSYGDSFQNVKTVGNLEYYRQCYRIRYIGSGVEWKIEQFDWVVSIRLRALLRCFGVITISMRAWVGFFLEVLSSLLFEKGLPHVFVWNVVGYIRNPGVTGTVWTLFEKPILLDFVSCQIDWPFDLVRLDLQAWTVSRWVSVFTRFGTFAGVKL